MVNNNSKEQTITITFELLSQLVIGTKDLGTWCSNVQVAKPTKPPKARSTTHGKKTYSKEVSNKEEVSNMKRATTRSKG